MKFRNEPLGRHPYLIVCMAFALLLPGVFIYAALVPPVGGKHPLPCSHVLLVGESCASCGLSGSFSFLMRGQVKAALRVYPPGLAVFLFFGIQFFMRLAAGLAYIKQWLPPAVLLWSDVGISLCLFLWAFVPLLL